MVKLVDARSLANKAGIKVLVYGPPGTAKTPTVGTAESPVLLAMETGTLSLRNTPVAACYARTVGDIEDYMKWLTTSNESKQFATLCFDSMSEMAEIYLRHFESRLRDGRQVYGEMSKAIRRHMQTILSLDRDVYMIAKLGMREVTESRVNTPYFPGQDLITHIPHEVDELFYVSYKLIPQVGKTVLCYQTFTDTNTTARDRSGTLAQYEEPNLRNIFNKIKAGLNG